MKLHVLVLLGLFSITACKTTPDYSRPLPPGAPALLPLEPGEPRPEYAQQWTERQDILPALAHSIAWMKRKASEQFFPIEGVTHDRALRSLVRFQDLLQTTQTEQEFHAAIESEFQIYKSAGWNGRGDGVLFTGYCTPILKGSKTRSDRFDHPLYALPPDLVKTPTGEILGRKTADGLEPYPARGVIEAGAILEGKGLELVYLADPLDAFIAHVNGSAFVELEEGGMTRLGYAGKNGRPYTSLGQELVKAKELRKDEVSLPAIRRWAKANPERLDEYLHRNESYVFFTPIDHNPHGSLNVPVTGWRSLATDKTLFPRGAIVFVETKLNANTNLGAHVNDFLFDQDTGGAIRTAGRGDVYLGVGPEAEQLAGTTRAEGQLYYFFLHE